MITIEKNVWVKTDDFQWRCYRGNGEYEFYELSDMNLDKKVYGVFHDTVQVMDFISSDIKDEEIYKITLDILASYGYRGSDIYEYETYRESLQDVLKILKEICGDEYQGIIAECIFESIYLMCPDKRFTNKKEALQYIKQQLKNN